MTSQDAFQLKIGRIIALFRHTFLSKTTTFAEVSWFDDVYTDPDSGLIYILTSAQIQSVHSSTTLSRPLVVAHDDEEIDKMWILNY